MIYGPLVYEESLQVPLWLSCDNQEAFDLVVGDFVSDHVCRKYNRNDGIHIYFDV